MKPCRSCDGKGSFTGIVCPPGRVLTISCPTCAGTGQVEPEQDEWVRVGMLLYQQRIRRQLSLEQGARRLGVAPSVLTDMEHGQVEPAFSGEQLWEAYARGLDERRT